MPPLTIQDIRREIRRAIAPFLPLLPPGSGPGSGDVVGPAGATDEEIAIFDGATGKLLQGGGVRLEPGASDLYLRPLSAKDLWVQGWPSNTAPGDLYLIGGSDLSLSVPGGDVYLKGGTGSQLGNVYIQGFNVEISGAILFFAFATYGAGLATDLIKADGTLSIQDSDGNEKIGIDSAGDLYTTEMLHEGTITLLAAATAYSF